MTEKQQIFDKIFKADGGIFDIYDDKNIKLKEVYLPILSMANSTTNYLRNHFFNKYIALPEIHFDFIYNDALNARATKYGDAYFIGIFTGAHWLIQDMFYKMFSTKSILPHLGNSSIESDEKKTLNAIITDFGISMDFNENNIVYPLDDLRYFYATAYASFVIQFLILHEIGHIVRGHNGYLSSLINGFVWSEVEGSVNKSHGITFLDSQTLEMDADSFALNQSFLASANFIDNPSLWDKQNPQLNLLYRNFPNALEHWTFAIYSFFRLLGFNEINLEKARQRSHPPPAIRMGMLCGNIESLLHYWKIPDKEKIMSCIVESTIRAEKSFTDITFHNNQYGLFAESYILGKGYMFEIANNWNNVRPLLEPFAFGELPPLANNQPIIG